MNTENLAADDLQLKDLMGRFKAGARSARKGGHNGYPSAL